MVQLVRGRKQANGRRNQTNKRSRLRKQIWIRYSFHSLVLTFLEQWIPLHQDFFCNLYYIRRVLCMYNLERKGQKKKNFKRCRFSLAGNVHLKIASPRFPPIRFICNALLRHMYKPDQQKYKYEDKDINRTWYPNNHRDLTKKRCLKKCTLFRMRSWKRLWSLMSAVRGKKYLLSVTLM